MEPITYFVKAMKGIEGELVEGEYGKLPELSLGVARWIGMIDEYGERAVVMEGICALTLYHSYDEKGKVERPEIFSLVCLRQIVSAVHTLQ